MENVHSWGTTLEASKPCDEMISTLDPISFNLGKAKLSIEPKGYTHDAPSGRCQIDIEMTAQDQFRLGTTFFRNFYTALDYTYNKIFVGVNKGMQNQASFTLPTPAPEKKPDDNFNFDQEKKQRKEIHYSEADLQKHLDKMDVPWLISYYLQSASDFMRHNIGDKVTEVVFQVLGPANTILQWFSVPLMIFINSLVQMMGALIWLFVQPALAISFAIGDDDGSYRNALDNGYDSDSLYDKFLFWSFKFTYQA